MAEIDFSNPVLLMVLPFLLLAVLALWNNSYLQSIRLVSRRVVRQVFYHSVPVIFTSDSARHTGITRSWLQLFSTLLITCCLCVALAGPYRVGAQLPDSPAYRDTLFLVDNEISMVLRDYLVNGERTDRLTMVVSTINYLIDRLENSRIGIITFSEVAQVLVPMTTDNQLLKHQINRIRPAVTGRTSDPANAMLFALNRLQKDYKNAAIKPSLVMISAANRTPRDINPVDTAALLHEQGYTLHMIAIGAASSEASEASNAALIYQPANITLLRDIARAGNGKFFHASNSEALSNALQAIRESEKSRKDTLPVFIEEPLYEWPLAIAMLTILLNTLAQTRRSAIWE